MKSIRLINYRSLKDSEDICIKPLTFLLGANSTGKSSFLKILPLLKQSTGPAVRGTFLWNGSLVDFKDFQNVVHDGKGNITVEFHLKNVPVSFQRLFLTNGVIEDCVVRLVITKRPRARWDYLKSFLIDTGKSSLQCECRQQGDKLFVDKVVVNGKDFSDRNHEERTYMMPYYGLIPRYLYKSEHGTDDESDKVLEEIGERLFAHETEHLVNYRRYLREISIWAFHGKPIREFFLSRISKDCPFTDEELSEIGTLALYGNLNLFIDTVNTYLSMMAQSITYVAPLRANFERYYRFQNYAVDTIDADGRNLAMFLNSLDKEKMSSFNDWLSEIFKFTIKITPSIGHVAIELKEDGKEYRNLVDLGFGYTELLPILAMIWKDTELEPMPTMSKNGPPHIFAIEQPELHLHPRFQAKFAHLLARVITHKIEKGQDVRFVIETHSDVIINKIGQLIAEGEFNSENTSVVLFNAQHEGLDKYVENTSYSSDGYIKNWPYGFFEEDTDYVD